MCNKIVNRQNAHRVRVLLPSIPVSELTDLQLEELLRSLSRLEEQSVVVVAETMAELRRRGEGWAVLGWWDRRRRTKWMWTGWWMSLPLFCAACTGLFLARGLF